MAPWIADGSVDLQPITRYDLRFLGTGDRHSAQSMDAALGEACQDLLPVAAGVVAPLAVGSIDGEDTSKYVPFERASYHSWCGFGAVPAGHASWGISISRCRHCTAASRRRASGSYSTGRWGYAASCNACQMPTASTKSRVSSGSPTSSPMPPGGQSAGGSSPGRSSLISAGAEIGDRCGHHARALASAAPGRRRHCPRPR